MKYLTCLLLVAVLACGCGFNKKNAAGLAVGGALTFAGVGLSVTHEETGNDALRGFGPAASLVGVIAVAVALIAELARER